MGLLPRRRTIVVWSSSPARGAGHAAREITWPARTGRNRRWLRAGALLTIIGLMRLARTARKYPRPALSLVGTAVTVVGITLPSEAVLVSGFVILLVTLFIPDRTAAPVRPCSARLWAMPLTPFSPSARHVPPSN